MLTPDRLPRIAPRGALPMLVAGLGLLGVAACTPPPGMRAPDSGGDAAAIPAESQGAGGNPDAGAAPRPTDAPDEPTLAPDTGWETLRPGVERRGAWLRDAEGRVLDRLVLYRLDPEQLRFEVAYRPTEALDLPSWQTETEALLLVNGGYFTEEGYATGLVIAQGTPSGASYTDFAGMLQIDEAGVPRLRALGDEPWRDGETAHGALQSFPLLVRPDGSPGYPEDDGIRSRRTAIGQDGQGRIVLALAPGVGATLHDLSAWLAASDLDLRLAFNLDGGTSTGLLMAEPYEHLPAFVRLPTVIAVYPR